MTGVGRGIGRIELGGGKHALFKAAFHLVRIEGISQIAGHQRSKIVASRNSVEDALAIGDRGINGGDWRNQVRHDNRAAIDFAGVGDNGFQHVTIAQMDMPVVRAADFQNLGMCSH
ncbi:hypothetical protein D3C85_1567560 [compost metagenome]